MERLEIEARRHAQARANRERGPMLIFKGYRATAWTELPVIYVRSESEGKPDDEKAILLDTIQPDQPAPELPRTCDCMDCSVAGENTH